MLVSTMVDWLWLWNGKWWDERGRKHLWTRRVRNRIRGRKRCQNLQTRTMIAKKASQFRAERMLWIRRGRRGKVRRSRSRGWSRNRMGWWWSSKWRSWRLTIRWRRRRRLEQLCFSATICSQLLQWTELGKRGSKEDDIWVGESWKIEIAMFSLFTGKRG